MYRNLIIAEQEKVFKRKVLWVALALLALGAVVLPGMTFATTRVAEERDLDASEVPDMTWPGGLIWVFQNLASPLSVAGILIVVVVAATWGDEYRWRILHQWLSRGISRPQLLSAKFFALLVPALLTVLTVLLVGGLTTGVLSYVANGTLYLQKMNALQIALSVLRAAYALLPLTALTLLFAVLTRSTAGTVGAGIAYLSLGTNIIGGLLGIVGLGELVLYLPGPLTSQLMAQNGAIARDFSPTVSAVPMPSAPTAILGLALWTLLFLALAGRLFQRQDLAS